MKYNLNNKKLGAPRLWWKKYNSKTKQSPSVLIKCGDCDNTVKIYFEEKKYRDKKFDYGIEINGVLAPYEFWRQLFKKIGL